MLSIRIKMVVRVFITCGLLLGWCGQSALGQSVNGDGRHSVVDPSITPIQARDARNTRFTKVTRGTGTLPNSAGQVWREYDIEPYVRRMKNTERPEQAIVDWVLRDTGTDMWFREPVGVLSANSTTLKVYHTPKVQRIVAKIVDRFVGGVNQSYGVSIRLLTVGNVNWRESAWPALTPVTVNSPGVEAWLIEKEGAAVLLANLRSRGDFREHNSPNMLVRSGQSETLRQSWPRSYMRGVERSGDGRYQLSPGEVRAGYSLKISPLVAIDGRTVDAAIKCNVNQIERMTPLSLNVPSGTVSQRVQVEVPQVASWSVHERFRWPIDKVLLVSRGVVAMPGLEDSPKLIPGLSKLVNGVAPRADALLMLECKPIDVEDVAEKREELRSGQLRYRGRY